MARAKYQKDAKGRSILGTQFGITVTRPWTREMYIHNDKIANIMKANIKKSFNKTISCEPIMEEKLMKMSKYICSYGFCRKSYSLGEIHERTLEQLERAENYWLHDIYPMMEKAGYVPSLETYMVGYDKL